MQAGQSPVTLEGGNITFACPGNFTVKGGQHVFHGGEQLHASFSPLPSDIISAFSRKVILSDQNTNSALANMPYCIRLQSGLIFHGVTDSRGVTDMDHSKSAEIAKVYTRHAALREISKIKDIS